MPFLDNVNNLRETQRLEFKEAAHNVPEDVWETYSAFANTEGGEIVLGVTENVDHTFTITGVKHAGSIVDLFWTTLRNPQRVERDVLLYDSVSVENVMGADVIIIRVPRAERGEKPVRVKPKRERQFVAWIRRGTSDIRASHDDIRQMEYDNARRADRQALEDFPIDALNERTIERYRRVFAGNKPSSPYNKDSREDFLYHIGALTRGRSGRLCPTQAGLLAFGHEYEITNYLPHYLLDYRQETTGAVRWDDRIVSQSGDWSGNLMDFYLDVTARLLRGFRIPFTTDSTGARHGVGNPVTEAVNEAVANALIHAYYGGESNITVVLSKRALTVTNPGSMLVDRDVAIAGGVSEQRNPTLMRMFAFMGVSDRAGSGVQNIFDTWAETFDVEPTLVEGHAPSSVKLTLPLVDEIALRSSGAREREGKLTADGLLAFVSASRDGVTSREVSVALGVSQRVAQKHLASLCADPFKGVERVKDGRAYRYRVG